MSKGIIYVCSTAVDGLIKIGKTKNFESRMTTLEANGYRNVTGLKRQFAIEVDNYGEIETLLNDLFAKSKVGKTELFSMELNKIIQLLSAFQGKQIYPKNETKKEVFERATQAVQNALLPNGEYYLNVNQRRNGNQAKAILLVKDGQLTLKKSSTIGAISEKVTKDIKLLSASLRAKNNFLEKDTNFTSVSSAASVVLGQNCNGWNVWKDKDGQYINKYRKISKEEN